MSRGSLKRTNANVKAGPRLVQSGIINFGDFEVKHGVTSWLTGSLKSLKSKSAKTEKWKNL